MMDRHQIADLYDTLGLTYEGSVNFTILSIPEIHPEIPFKSPDLRADYFSFIFTKEGSGCYYLDDHQFPFGSNSFYFTNPGHLKSYELHASKEAHIIMLTEKFLQEFLQPDVYREFPFLLAEIVPPQALSNTDLDVFVSLYAQIFREFQQPGIYQHRILGNLMLNMLLKVKEKFWLNYNPIEEGNRNSEIVRSFKVLLETQFMKALDGEKRYQKLQVQDFANALNLHPNYLNSVIKSKTGKTINDWLTERTLSTAKSLLKSTTHSSKAIAYQLGFSEPTHFSRFFKKHTHLSPGKFREIDQS